MGALAGAMLLAAPPARPTVGHASRRVPAAAPGGQLDRFRKLRAVLPALARRAPGRVAAIWVEDRLHNRRFAVNADLAFRSASLIKLPIAGATYEYWQRHPQRRTPQLEKRVWRMVAESHNPSTDVVIDHIGGLGRVNDYSRRHGLRGTRLRRKLMDWRHNPAFNETTPRDVAASLRDVDRGSLVSRAASWAVWKAMKQQVLVQRIPAGLPRSARVEVGNKTGTNSIALHDAAIVRGNGLRYLLVIMIDHPRSEAAGDAYCRGVSAAVYRALIP